MYCTPGQPLFSLTSSCRVEDAYPSALPQAVQAQLVRDLGRVHGVGQILLVGEDQEQCIPQFILVQHPLQLLARLDDTVTVIAVDDEDDALRVLEVMPPQRPDLVLPADIPHGELDVLVFHRLDVESCAERRRNQLGTSRAGSHRPASSTHRS